MGDVKRENVNWPNIVTAAETFWILLLIFGRKRPEFPEQLIIEVLGFLGTQLCVLWGGPNFQSRDFIPTVNQSHWATQKCGFESWSSHRHRWEVLMVWNYFCWRNPTWTTLGWYLLTTVIAVNQLRCLFLSLPWLCCLSPGSSAAGVSSPALIWGLCRASLAAHVIRDVVGGTSTGRCSQQQLCCRDASKPVFWILHSDGAVRPQGHSAILSVCFLAWACDEISLCAAFCPGIFTERVIQELSLCKNICENDALCHYVAVMNLQRIWLGREWKAWLGTVICSLPAASRVEAIQGTMGRVGMRKGVTRWSDGKAAHPTLSKRGDTVLSPWDVPNLELPGGPCCGWPLTCGIACEGEELRLLISMARNLFVLWLLCPWAQAAAFSCGLLGSWSCKGICLPGTPGAAPWICKARGISVSVCPSLCAVLWGCSMGWFNLLDFEIISHIKPQSPQPAVSSVWARWGLAQLLHVKEWVGECPSVLGASLHLLSALGQCGVCVSSHITGPSLWFPWPLIIQINNHNKSPCASLGK